MNRPDRQANARDSTDYQAEPTSHHAGGFQLRTMVFLQHHRLVSGNGLVRVRVDIRPMQAGDQFMVREACVVHLAIAEPCEPFADFFDFRVLLETTCCGHELETELYCLRATI